ncbi:MAG TPA: thiamine pyrophosphate-dependent enzyme, partial [Stellaceae bacterium]|nr:thiamine pyrophosphate-dependent enzyme [Stellaceae bacterium]
FICENNGYAFSARQEDHQRVPNVSDRAAAYGMPGQVVDGNDVDAVRAAVAPAVARARQGAGPTLFDMKTYRWYGQYDADDSLAYRSQAEIDRWKERCPIETCRRRLEAARQLTPAAFDAMRREIDAALSRSVAAALASPPASPADAARLVYAASDVR